MIWYRMGLVLIPVLLFLSILLLRMGDRIMAMPQVCSFYNLTGLYCPACGMTRAFYELLHGRILQSLRMNPALMTGLASYLFFMINTTVCLTTKKGGWRSFPITAVIIANLIFMVLQCIVRNIICLFG